MKTVLSLNKWLTLISGVLISVVGITMLFTPVENLVLVAIYIGCSILISGLSDIINYLSFDIQERNFWTLSSGIISVIISLWVIFGHGRTVVLSLLPFTFGIWILGSSITRLIGSLSFRNNERTSWNLYLVFGCIGIVFGIILLFTPMISATVISYLISLMILAYGVDNIIMYYILERISKRIREEIY